MVWAKNTKALEPAPGTAAEAASQPALSRLVEICESQGERPFRDRTLVMSQHLLPSVVPLFQALIQLGAEPERIHLLGKTYSTNTAARKQLESLGIKTLVPPEGYPGCYDSELKTGACKLWRGVHKLRTSTGVIILDHGGILRTTIPLKLRIAPMIAIEHTTCGVFGGVLNSIPCLDMARSWIKREIEAPIIAREITNSLSQLSQIDSRNHYGICGMGTIGRALAKRFADRHCKISAYDSSRPKLPKCVSETAVRYCDSAEEVFSSADVTFGCTGRDQSKALENSSINSEHFIVSCSSSDKEFSELLKTASPRQDGDHFKILFRKNLLWIMNRGFPINFYRGEERSTMSEIQITRALTLLSLLQAAEMLENRLYFPVSAAGQKQLLALLQEDAGQFPEKQTTFL